MARVTLVDQNGCRLLDTLVKPQNLEVAIKSGLKQDLFTLSKSRAESIDVVRRRVREIIKGKKLIGYHLPQKIQDFGLLTDFGEDEQIGSPQKITAP